MTRRSSTSPTRPAPISAAGGRGGRDARPARDGAGERGGDDRRRPAARSPRSRSAGTTTWSDAREEIARRSSASRPGRRLLVLTDMFGGTPSNLAMTFLEPGRVEVVTGVNLPMLLKLASAARDGGPAGGRARRCASTAAERRSGSRPICWKGAARIECADVTVIARGRRSPTRWACTRARPRGSCTRPRASQSQVRVTRGERTMDGKSIMGMLLLAAARGTHAHDRGRGPDERTRVDALCALVRRLRRGR